MGAELARMEPQSVVHQPVSILEIVRDVAANPNADVSKLERLIDLQERYEKNQARIAFNRAMKDAQEEMEPVRRDARNEQNRSRYARLETIDSQVRPAYTRHGFSLSFSEIDAHRNPENVRIRCNVHHEDGHTEPYELEAPPDIMGPQGKANKTGVQGMGSTVSYLRRYLETMIFNIVLTNEDTDGQRNREEATANHSDGQQPEPPEPAPAKPAPPPTGGKAFDHLKGFAELKKRFIALGREDEYRDGLSKWGKKKSSEFTASEMGKGKPAAECWKYLAVRINALEVKLRGLPVERLGDPVTLVEGTRCWFEGATWEVWDSPEGHDWRKVG